MGARFTKYNFTKTQYFQMPKGLFLIRKYHDELSLEAKVIYSILLDKVNLSYKNGYFEDNGDIFCYFKWDDLRDLAAIKKTTFFNALAKLRELNLIYTVKQPYSNANKIYVNMLDDAASDDDIYDDKSNSDFYSLENIRELEAIGRAGNMDSGEINGASYQGQLDIGGRRNASITPKSDALDSRTSGFAMRTTPGSTKKSLQNLPDVGSYSGLAGSEYELTGSHSELMGSDGEPAGSKSRGSGSNSGGVGPHSELLNSKTESNKTNSKTEQVERERIKDRGKREETRAHTHILVDNPSETATQGAINPDAMWVQGGASEGNYASVDNFSTGEDAKVAPAQDGFAEVFTLYSENIQANPVPLVINALRNLFDKHGKDILTEAITQAALSSTPQEKKGFNYVASIVERIAGNKANNFTDYSQVTPAQKVSGNDVKVMPRYSKPVQHSMSESRENIHNMIDSIFGTADEAGNGGKVNDGTDKAGAC